MREVRFQQVDVFTAVPYQGNPVAVVFDGDRFSDDEMQRIANWTNLSETTFVCKPTKPEADYRLRIFTPRAELPFAGHPTIGSAHAVLRAGLKLRTPGRLVQECAKGFIELRVDGERIALALPAPLIHIPKPEELAAATSALGVQATDVLAAHLIDVGPIWLTLQLADADAVLALRPAMDRLAAATARGTSGVVVVGVYESGTPADVEVRAFAPAHGVPEDPVCGSGNGAAAALLLRNAEFADWSGYVAAQGRCVGRDGRVFVEFAAGGAIWIGGSAVTCVEGTLFA
jgi:PhzF family phenazine biosynthesis protein